jgi:hypothetical protein
MANIEHSVLTGTEIHEPKGAADALLGQVYVADGNGSGNWTNIGASSFTGMIADFAWPVVQEGWLECDGSDINITTYGALYSTMTIQQTGTRTLNTAVVTSLSSTTPMRVGYYVYGIGIPEDTTVVTIDSATQITMSTNASSSGTTTVIVSPWRLGNGVIRLPNLSAAGMYRRSRTSNTSVGQTQDDTLAGHTHTGTTSLDGSHNHTISGNTGDNDVDHTHNTQFPVPDTRGLQGGTSFTRSVMEVSASQWVNSQGSSNHHVHPFSGTTSTSSSHQHTFTTNSTGGTETRPKSIVLMTCVKT